MRTYREQKERRMATVGDIRRKNLWLKMECRNCRRLSYMPWRLFPPRSPDDLPDYLAAAHFRCSQCGSKDLKSEMASAMLKNPPSW